MAKTKWLNPAEKSRKYAGELRTGIKVTNDGEVKTDRRGNPKKLTRSDRQFRYGYLQARRDNGEAHKAQAGKKTAKPPGKKPASGASKTSPKKNAASGSKGAVYDYSKFYDFDERGRIKGSTTPDGFFEPD